MSLSKTFDRWLVREIGLYDFGWSFGEPLPFHIGVMYASFHWGGTIPVVRDSLKSLANILNKHVPPFFEITGITS
jgi:hypothetical protein